MNLIEATSTVFTRKYIDFLSRATRSEFWFASLVRIIVPINFFLFVCYDANVLVYNETRFRMYRYTFVLYFLFLQPALLSISVRRMHDLNKSRWFVHLFYVLDLILFVGIISSIVVLILFAIRGTIGAKKFRPDPLNKYN